MSEIIMKKSDSVQIKGAVRTYEGKTGADIREYVVSKKYTGPTKSGLWIPIANWEEFKELVARMDKEVQIAKELGKEIGKLGGAGDEKVVVSVGKSGGDKT